jgi:hypothetical protein
MSDAVLGALISAGASILIAILNKKISSPEGTRPPVKRPTVRGGRQTPIPSETYVEVQRPSPKAWYVTFGLLSVWMALTPALIHHDLAGTNFLLIPVVAVILALVVPIAPLKAAWLCFAMFAVNFVVGPLSNRAHGSMYDTSFLGSGPQGEAKRLLTFILSLATGTAAAAWLICFLRLKYRRQGAVKNSNHPHASLSSELEKLAQLRTSGVLSEAEFLQAKAKLLGGNLSTDRS